MSRKIESFLRGLRTIQPSEILGLVFGNPSADLDSICSSICFSFMLSKLAYYNRSPSAVVLPVINIPKCQFKLRLEAQFLLNRFLHLDDDENLEDLLLFRDSDIIQTLFSAPSPPQQTFHLSLVDHNEFSPPQFFPSWASSRLFAIVDHHVDAGALNVRNSTNKFDNWTGGPIRWIAGTGVGSCASMVACLWREVIRNYQLPSHEMDEQVRLMLLYTIIRDTIGLNESLRNSRWGAEDEDMVNWLKMGMAVDANKMIDIRTSMNEFEALKSNRQIHRDLGIDGMLLMDMKIYHYSTSTIVYSSMTIPLNEFHLMFDNFKSSLSIFAKCHNAHMLILMSCSSSSTPSSSSPSSSSEALERWMALFLPEGVPNRGNFNPVPSTL